MRVLISGLWRATQPSGICRTIVSLVRGLNEVAPEVEVAVAVGEWQRGYLEQGFGMSQLKVDVVAVDIPNTSVNRNGWYLFHLPQIARRLKADLVHLAFPAPVFRRTFSSPIVTTLHDLYPFDCAGNFGYPGVLFNRAALLRSLSAADRIVCVSEFTLARLRGRFPKLATKAVRVANPIAISGNGAERQTLVREPFVLAVAQHRANKNLDLLLRSFHRYRSYADSDPNVRLAIVGMDGPETGHLHELVHSLKLHEAVLFLSNVSESELAALYRQCELFVTLSSIEGFGLPLGEAIAYGTRVVASEIPAHRNTGGEACQYVRLGGSDEVGTIAESFRRAQRNARPSSPVAGRSTIADCAAQYLEIYNSLLGETAPQYSTSKLSTWEQQ